MLSELMRLLQCENGTLNLSHLSKELGAQPSAIAGMIETLIQKGRILEVTPECGVCDSCASKPGCDLPASKTKRYIVVSRGSPLSQESRSW